MTMTVAQLLKKTTPGVKSATIGVNIGVLKPSFISRGANLGARKLTAVVTSVTKGPNNLPKWPPVVKHQVTVEGYNKGNVPLCAGPVIVDCTCEDFTYRWEVALHRKGAARLKRSNGEDPDTKNPTYLPSVCKHLYSVLDHIQQSAYTKKPI